MIEITLPIILQTIQTVSLVVGIFYYLTIMSDNQKRQKQEEDSRKTQTFVQLHQARYDKEGLDAMFLLYSLEWDDFDDYLEKYAATSGKHNEISAAFESQSSYMDGLGLMVKENMIDAETVYHVAGRRVLMLWFKLETVIKGFRHPQWGALDYCEHFEYLANEMIRIRQEKGLPIAYTYLIHPTSELQQKYNQ